MLAAKGRHDPCVVPRAVPIVEAMAALVLADAALIQESRTASSLMYEHIGRAKPRTDVPQTEEVPKATKD